MSKPTVRDVLAFVQRHDHAVEATVAPNGHPQAAVVGIVTSDAFEIVFDTEHTTRKCQNLRTDNRMALVVGWDVPAAQTVQIEGVADEPTAADLERLQTLYFDRFPDGVERLAWGTIVHVRLRPTWVRYSDFRGEKPVIIEFGAEVLLGLNLS